MTNGSNGSPGAARFTKFAARKPTSKLGIRGAACPRQAVDGHQRVLLTARFRDLRLPAAGSPPSTPASCTDHRRERQITHGERIYPLQAA